jgi:predicted transcriptional regulator
MGKRERNKRSKQKGKIERERQREREGGKETIYTYIDSTKCKKGS